MYYSKLIFICRFGGKSIIWFLAKSMHVKDEYEK